MHFLEPKSESLKLEPTKVPVSKVPVNGKAREDEKRILSTVSFRAWLAGLLAYVSPGH